MYLQEQVLSAANALLPKTSYPLLGVILLTSLLSKAALCRGACSELSQRIRQLPLAKSNCKGLYTASPNSYGTKQCITRLLSRKTAAFSSPMHIIFHDLLIRVSITKCSSLILQGLACNVSKPSDVAALAEYAKDQLGGVDIW